MRIAAGGARRAHLRALMQSKLSLTGPPTALAGLAPRIVVTQVERAWAAVREQQLLRALRPDTADPGAWCVGSAGQWTGERRDVGHSEMPLGAPGLAGRGAAAAGRAGPCSAAGRPAGAGSELDRSVPALTLPFMAAGLKLPLLDALDLDYPLQPAETRLEDSLGVPNTDALIQAAPEPLSRRSMPAGGAAALAVNLGSGTGGKVVKAEPGKARRGGGGSGGSGAEQGHAGSSGDAGGGGGGGAAVAGGAVAGAGGGKPVGKAGAAAAAGGGAAAAANGGAAAGGERAAGAAAGAGAAAAAAAAAAVTTAAAGRGAAVAKGEAGADARRRAGAGAGGAGARGAAGAQEDPERAAYRQVGAAGPCGAGVRRCLGMVGWGCVQGHCVWRGERLRVLQLLCHARGMDTARGPLVRLPGLGQRAALLSAAVDLRMRLAAAASGCLRCSDAQAPLRTPREERSRESGGVCMCGGRAESSASHARREAAGTRMHKPLADAFLGERAALHLPQ